VRAGGCPSGRWGSPCPFVLIFLAAAANRDAHLGTVAVELVAYR
jgi:hypothetical protein